MDASFLSQFAPVANQPGSPQPHAQQPQASAPSSDGKLASLLDRISKLTSGGAASGAKPSGNEIAANLISASAPSPVADRPASPARPAAPASPANVSARPGEPAAKATSFFPMAPASIPEAGLTPAQVEMLILKYLLARGDSTGRDAADQIKLPFVLVDALMRQMKHDQLVVYRADAPMNDYLYQLTDLGREAARRLAQHCSYFGAAPVTFNDYVRSVNAQSLTTQHPCEADLRRAFSDLLINDRIFRRLGPAINSGRGLFLYGPAGNGKTSIAERVTRAFGTQIWIPRSISIDGEIVRLFDPNVHEEVPVELPPGLIDQTCLDRRWVRIKRPTIVVGGELTMENLEVQFSPSTGICEAPVQLKSNCGTLVVDDFGRQRMSIDQLLNRWIVPLEKRYDILNLPNGKKIQTPFDQLVIFATNLQPKDLVDEAFLRRIPYKVEVLDPSEQEFRALFKLMCPGMGFDYDDAMVTWLLEKHFRPSGRPMRSCQPRDLLQQVRNHCSYHKLPLELRCEYLDLAVENYFAVM